LSVDADSSAARTCCGRSGREQRQQAPFVEQRPVSVARVGDAIGEHQQRLAGSQHFVREAERHARQQPDRGAGGFQPRADDAGTRGRYRGRFVPGVDVTEAAVRGIEHADEHRGEHVGAVVGTRDVVVDRGQQRGQLRGQRVAAGQRALGTGAQQAAKQCHEQRRADALVADVGDHQHEPLVVQRERVVEVAADLARGLEAGGELPAFRLRQRVGQEAGLDPAGDVDLALQRACVQLLAVSQPLLRQARADTRAQDVRVERLGQVIVGAHLDALDDAVGVVERGDQDHRQVHESRIGVGAQVLQQLEAVHLRHHDVEQHQVVRRGLEHRQRIAAVDRGLDRVALALQAAREHVAVHFVVVHDEHARRVGAGVVRRVRGRERGRGAHAALRPMPASMSRRTYGSSASIARSPRSIRCGMRWVSPRRTWWSNFGMIGTISAWCTAL
jgi:hypothetical protein